MSLALFDARRAYDDILLGLTQLPLAQHLAAEEMRMRYARTMLGPLWITATMGLWVLVLGVVFGGLFGLPLREVLPWITLGLITWSFISQVVVESSSVLPVNRGLLLQAKMSISMFVVLVILRNLIIAAHNLVIFAGLLLLFRLPITWIMLYSILAIPIIIIIAFGLGLFAAITGARFRDLPPLYASLANMGMLALPIMWRPSDLQHNHGIANYNPLTYVLSIFRDPLLGTEPDVMAFVISLAVAVVVLATGVGLLARTRRRITLWL